ncbi:MAG: cell division protein FtsH, partial [Planctomycetes bacterium]|nr:cell division protein FtsH [Planctomycetota bacterium]
RQSMLGVPSLPAELPHSEDTIREIDLEIRRIIDEASQTAHEVLTNRRDVLDHMARELMEVEVMDADHLKRILDEHKTVPQIKPGTHAAPGAASAGEESSGPRPASPATGDGAESREPAEGA